MSRGPVPQIFADVVVVTPGNPAAGANLVYTLPAGYRYQVVSVKMTLATDANVANRNCVLQYTDATPTLLYESTSISHAANITNIYIYADFGYKDTAAVAGRLEQAANVHMTLRAGWIVRTLINNVQVGDQLSAIAITMHRWEETAP